MARSITMTKEANPTDFVARSTGRRIPCKPGEKLAVGGQVEVELPSGRTGRFTLLASEIDDLAAHPHFGGPTEAQLKPTAEEPQEIADVEEAPAEGEEPAE